MTNETKLRVPISRADHSQGSPDAPLILLEYGDYECSYCGKAYRVIRHLQQTLKNDLRFVFRNFPLASLHPNAMVAAQAAESAGLQGQFWEMHDILYRNQDSLDLDSLTNYATILDLDLTKFLEGMERSEVEEKIRQDIYGGARSGVNGTPNFFVNGSRFDDDWSYESLLSFLNDLRSQPSRKAPKKKAA
ncbi:MAG: DsbA family protein [Bdellovibrionia bacterium]